MGDAPDTLHVHIGYPKTGTTTLQTSVYPQLSGVAYLGKTYPRKPLDHWETAILRGLYYHGEGREDRERRFTAGVAALRAVAARTGSARPLLLSSESILSQCLLPALPGLDSSRGEGRITTTRSAVAHLVRFVREAGFARVRVLVTVRPQRELLPSFFAESADRFRRIPELRTFDAFVRHNLADGPLLPTSAFDFDDLSRALDEALGPEAHLFLSLASLKRDPDAFVDRLGAFVGFGREESFASLTRENPRKREDGSFLTRRLNAAYHLDVAKRRLLPGRSLGLGRYLRKLLVRLEYGADRVAPDPALLESIRAHYAPSNARLVERFPELAEDLA